MVGLATQGPGSPDDERLRDLLGSFDAEFLDVGRVPGIGRRLLTAVRLTGALLRRRPDLVVMEGTGIVGGVAILAARALGGVPYVVSSGDAVAPFVRAQHPALGPVAHLYERLLYRRSAGVIGWTPYITGRALTLGAPRAATVPAWAPDSRSPEELAEAGRAVRESLGIATDSQVIGIVGSLVWNPRVQYCYGLELVEALRCGVRPGIVVVIVGEGSGRVELERRAGALLGDRIHLVGRVSRAAVLDHVAAMDVASLPQSVDQVGAFRYGTKLGEYVAARVPVVTGRLPAAYDLDAGWLWRLPGDAPWDRRYIEALAGWMNGLRADDVAARRTAVGRAGPAFDRAASVARGTSFLNEVLEDRGASR